MEWKDPPQTKKKWSFIFAELRKRPGEWALVSEDSSLTITSHIRKGELGGAKPGEFEATGRQTVSRVRGDIYVRYVGGE